MNFIYKVKSGFDRVVFYCAILATIALIVIMLGVVADAVGRWVGRPVYGVFELNKLLVGINVFLGLAFVQKYKKHITVDLLANKGPYFVRFFTAFFPHVLGFVFYAWITYVYWGMAYDSFLAKEVATGIVHFPKYPLKIAMAFGISLLTIQHLIDFIVEINQTMARGRHSVSSASKEVMGE